jgi:hypothetical protein
MSTIAKVFTKQEGKMRENFKETYLVITNILNKSKNNVVMASG